MSSLARGSPPPGPTPIPFDVKRMLMGDEEPLFLLEIAVRTAIIFVYTLLLLRLLGKRGVAQLSLLEVTIIIGLGSAVGDPMFDANVPLIHGMLVIGVIVGLYLGFMRLLRKSERFERFFEGSATCLVKDGRIDTKALDRERLSQEELFEILRLAGITHLGEVKRAYLEQSGAMSTFAFPPKEVKPGLPVVPPWDIADRATFDAADDVVLGEGAFACRACGEVLERAAAEKLPRCPRCRRTIWTRATAEPLGTPVDAKGG